MKARFNNGTALTLVPLLFPWANFPLVAIDHGKVQTQILHLRS